ncbi:unnamed protein product, partial [Closterium sp. NIES-54]
QLREWVIQRGHPGGGGYRDGVAGGAGGAGQQRQPAHPDTPSPQQIREWVVHRGRPCGGGYVFMEAAALGASESAAALGASEFAAVLGASVSTATSLASAEALHTFTLDSSASRCFFLPSGSLSGLHLPSFSTNLVSNAVLPDFWVGTFIPGGQRVVICICSWTGHHLATFTRQPGSSLYTLTAASAQVVASSQVAALSQVSASAQFAASCLYRERYFLLAVDDYTRYTTVFPLRSKAAASGVLIPWIRATHHQLRDRFRQDLRVLRLHSNRGETSPTLRWTGEVGDASAFRVWGTLSLVRDTTASKLSPRTLRCAFLGFPTDTPPWQFYHPHSRRIFSSQDITFDELVYFYRLHSHASHPVPLAPLFLVGPPPLVEPLVISSDTSGPAEGGDPAADDTMTTHRSPRLETPPGFPPRPSSPPLQLVALDNGATGDGDTGGEDEGGAGPGGAETRGEGSGAAA